MKAKIIKQDAAGEDPHLDWNILKPDNLLQNVCKCCFVHSFLVDI